MLSLVTNAETGVGNVSLSFSLTLYLLMQVIWIPKCTTGPYI